MHTGTISLVQAKGLKGTVVNWESLEIISSAPFIQINSL